MKIYTRSGDRGETDLIGGERVSKADARVEACGAVDELNSAVGAARSQAGEGPADRILLAIQDRLHSLCAELAHVPGEDADAGPRGETSDAGAPGEASDSGAQPVTDSDIKTLERHIDELEPDLRPLHGFILPGGTPEASLLHLARAVCRRVERRLVSLAEKESVRPELMRFMNRLSDLLFVLARHANHRAGVVEVQWKGRNSR